MDAYPEVTVSPFGVEFTYQPPLPRPSMRAICEEVSRKHRVSFADMASNRRYREFVLARQEAMWRCWQETSATLPMIGRILGGRDHSTIWHGIRRHQKRIDAGEA